MVEGRVDKCNWLPGNNFPFRTQYHFLSTMASESEDDGLEELEFEAEYDEDDTGMIDAQDDATEDGDEVCRYSPTLGCITIFI